MSKPLKNQDELTEKETAKRRDEIAKRMLNTAPTPRKKEQESHPKRHKISQK